MRKPTPLPVGAVLTDNCRSSAPGRTTRYENAAKIQADLDRYLSFYNLERSHQGYRLQGRAPAQALRQALGLTELPPLTAQETLMEEEPEAE